MSTPKSQQTSLTLKKLTRSLKQAIKNKQQSTSSPSIIDHTLTSSQTQSHQFMTLMKKIITQNNHPSHYQINYSQQQQNIKNYYVIDDDLHYIAEQSHQCSQSMFQVGNQYQYQNQHNQNNQILAMMEDKSKNKYKCSSQTKMIQSKMLQASSSSSKQKLAQTQLQSSFSSSESNSFTSKLIQITSRCVEYYTKFSQQKTLQFQTIQKTFAQMNVNLNTAFDQIINQANKKRNQLNDFLIKKYKDIIQLKNHQDQKLKSTLSEIKEIHLTNLIRKNLMGKQATQSQANQLHKHKTLSVSLQQIKRQPNSNSFFNSNSKNLQQSSSLSKPHSSHSSLSQQSSMQQCQLSVDLHNYASTLNIFYILMQDIQKTNYKQIVEQTISFISNLITEEIKSVLYEKIPLKLIETKMLKSPSKDFLNQLAGDRKQQQNKQCIGGLSKDCLFKRREDILQLEQAESQDIYTNIDQKYQHSNMLDSDSFAKLFLEQSKGNIQEEKIYDSQLFGERKQSKNIQNKNSEQNMNYTKRDSIKFLKQQKSKSSSLNCQENSKTISNPQSRIQKSKHKIFSVESSNQKFNQNSQPILTIDDQHIKTPKNELQKQNLSLQIIKKISNQQNNRSAKIKSYLETFQQAKQTIKNNGLLLADKTLSIDKKNKSPIKKQKSYPKLVNTNQRKSSMNNLNNLNGSTQKITTIQSSRGPRNSVQVSQFKTYQPRKVSVAAFK